MEKDTNFDDNNILSNAHWISAKNDGDMVTEFTSRFRCDEKLKQVTLNICGLGYFRSFVNGIETDNYYFKPIVADYSVRDKTKNEKLFQGLGQTVYYCCFDITALSKKGENELTVFTGNGYYCNEDKIEEPYCSYGMQKLIFEVRCEYDYHTVIFCSDDTVKARQTNIYSNLFNGDRIDFSKRSGKFKKTIYATVPSGRLTKAPINADILECTIAPIYKYELNGSLIYDFGINHTGGLRVKLNGKRGRKVTVKFAEVKNSDNTLNYNTSRWEDFDYKLNKPHIIDQQNEYVLSGGTDEISVWFSWKCYRYVEFIGVDGIQIESIESLFIHGETDKEEEGKFECSNLSFNEIYEKSVLTLKDNMHSGLITDCPHREKRQYTGDAQVVQKAVQFAFGCEDFYSKVLNDVLNAQTESGYVPNTAPYISGGGGYQWGIAVCNLPSVLYKSTGKIEYLERAYGNIVKWIEYIRNNSQDNIVIKNEDSWILGDWMTPKTTELNIKFMSTAVYYRAVDTAAFFAKELKREKDERRFTELCLKIKSAINREFFNEETLTYCKGVQGENILPLYYGIAPKRCADKMKANISNRYLDSENCCLDTGIVITPILLDYLCEVGMQDIALKIMENTSFPSYLNMLKGETTLCEHWSKKWPDYYKDDMVTKVKGGGDVSHCHSMFASVIEWLYKHVLGIDIMKVYEKKIYFAPKYIGKLSSAKGQIHTIYGNACLEWTVEDNALKINIEIPDTLTGYLNFKTPFSYFYVKEQDHNYCFADGKVSLILPAGKWSITGSRQIDNLQ